MRVITVSRPVAKNDVSSENAQDVTRLSWSSKTYKQLPENWKHIDPCKYVLVCYSSSAIVLVAYHAPYASCSIRRDAT